MPDERPFRVKRRLKRHAKIKSALRCKADIYFVELELALSMSAFPPKADVIQAWSELPFIAEGVEQL